MHFYLVQIAQRLDWFDYGVASISRTGAFVACAAVACWIFAGSSRKWVFWLSLLASGTFVYFLIQTQSRGAMIGFAVGVALVFVGSGMNWTRWRVIAVGLAALLGCWYAHQIGFARRVEQMVMLQSSSANVRGDIYLSGIKMIADAPQGWGAGNAAQAYRQWYQPPGETESYLSLLNSHLNFLTEHGVLARLGYFCFWSFVLCACMPLRKNIFAATALGVWVCFGLTACFSNVANFWVLWVIPVAALMMALIFHRKRLLAPRFWGSVIGGAVLCLGVLWGVSLLLPRAVAVKKIGANIYVGGTKEARALLLQPDLRVLGSTYGQELRQAMRARDGAHTVLVAPRWKKEMEGIDSIVISGEFPVGVLRHGKRIVLLNAQPDDTDRLAEFLKGKDVLVVVGGMGDWRLKRFWEQWLKENENPQIRSMVIQHAADYIPEWPRFLFETEEAS